MLQVAAGAAQLYADEMLQIPHLTQRGSQQLLADLEYYGNVLAALGVALPASLTTWQVCTTPSVSQCQCICLHA